MRRYSILQARGRRTTQTPGVQERHPERRRQAAEEQRILVPPYEERKEKGTGRRRCGVRREATRHKHSKQSKRDEGRGERGGEEIDGYASPPVRRREACTFPCLPPACLHVCMRCRGEGRRRSDTPRL